MHLVTLNDLSNFDLSFILKDHNTLKGCSLVAFVAVNARITHVNVMTSLINFFWISLKFWKCTK